MTTDRLFVFFPLLIHLPTLFLIGWFIVKRIEEIEGYVERKS